VFHISNWGFGALFVVVKPTKPPVATGLVTNRRLFWKLYYQTIPGVDIGHFIPRQWL